MNGGDRTTEAFLNYRENFSRYRDTVLECLSDALYRYRRYEVEFGAMLLYAETPFKPENYRDLVITSYSIHYTKLYDSSCTLLDVLVLLAFGGGFGRGDLQHFVALLPFQIGVITSYSIHYTKLYDA